MLTTGFYDVKADVEDVRSARRAMTDLIFLMDSATCVDSLDGLSEPMYPRCGELTRRSGRFTRVAI